MKQVISFLLLLLCYNTKAQVPDIEDQTKTLKNVSQMMNRTYKPGATYTVSDKYQGGVFHFYPSPYYSMTVDSGIVFPVVGGYMVRDISSEQKVNAWWFGVVPDSTVNSAPGFDRLVKYLGTQLSNSLQNGRAINRAGFYLPAGAYLYQGDGIGGNMGGNFWMEGAGQAQTRLYLDMPGKYFIDDSVNTVGFLIEKMQFNPKSGSSYAGIYRNRRTSNIAGNTIYYKQMIKVSCFGYTVCAVSSNSKDDPFYLIDNCKFRGANTSKGVMLPGGGGSAIQNSWFDGGSGYIHLRGASGMLINHNSFNGVHSPARGWKFDIQIEPNFDTTGIFPSAENLVICNNIHGNENDQTNDIMYLIAISDTTTNPNHTTAPDYGSYWPLLSQVDKNAYKIRNMTIIDEKLSTDAGLFKGIVTSYTENIGNCYIGRLKMDCSNRYIVEFPGLTAFDTKASYISTNYIDVSNNSYSVSVRYLCNVPGFGRVYDPQNSLRGTYSAVPALGQSYDYDFKDLINVGITSPSATVAITGGQTSIDGKANATNLRLNQPEGVVYYGVDTTGLIPGRPIWIEFDIAAGVDSSLKEVSVRLADNYTQSVAQRWQIEVPPASEGWRTVRLQHIWYARTGSSGLKVFFGGGSLEPVENIKYKIGRVRVYTARTPQIFPDGYWVTKDTTTFDRFFVSSGDYKRTMTKANVIADLGIVDYRPKTSSISGSNFTTTSTSAVDVTGLSIPVLANKKYKVIVTLFTSSTGTNGIYFGLNGPAGSATLSGQWVMTTTTATAFVPNRLGAMGALNSTSANRFASGGSATLIGFITTSGTAGNVTVQVASANGAETSSINVGSTIELTENQ